MMAQAKIEFEWVDAGFQQIISSTEVHKIVMDAAQRIAARAGDGFEAESYQTKGLRYDRPAGLVRAATVEAANAEAEDKELTKAVQSCRR